MPMRMMGLATPLIAVGMILTQAPLTDLVPVEPATMEGRTVIQWDKDAVESAGMVKVDVLSLRTLSAIEDALD